MSKLSVDSIDKNVKLIVQLAYQTYPNNDVMADLMASLALALLGSVLANKKHFLFKLAFKANNLFGITGNGINGYINISPDGFGSMKFAYNKSLDENFAQQKRLFEEGTESKPDKYHKVLAALSFEEAAVEMGRVGLSINFTIKLMDVWRDWVKDSKHKPKK